MMKMKAFLTAGLISATLPLCANITITGAGSTFVYPVLSVWANDYAKSTGTQINYQAIGSGGGIAQMKAVTVDFAATDKPLDAKDLEAGKLNQFPLVQGQIVLSENLKVSKPLKLDGNAIADIYLGKIKFWDDPSLQKLNPGLSLPHQGITVLYRADGSGTTYNFTRYLSSVSPTFKTEVGSDTLVSWPVGVGAKGNAGIANFIKTIPGSIGYVEYAYAAQNNLPIAITPKLMATTYILMPNEGPNNTTLKAFFQYCFDHPEVAKSLNYVPVK